VGITTPEVVASESWPEGTDGSGLEEADVGAVWDMGEGTYVSENKKAALGRGTDDLSDTGRHRSRGSGLAPARRSLAFR
jgi:hypothetical protein